eukprot:scaffold1761_cov357-Prasinococcus_capsulatus_cf.AAC.6
MNDREREAERARPGRAGLAAGPALPPRASPDQPYCSPRDAELLPEHNTQCVWGEVAGSRPRPPVGDRSGNPLTRPRACRPTPRAAPV